PHEEADTMQTIAKLKHEMSVLSGQVTSVSQELQEMTRLLKPLFHNPSMLLMRCAVTPPTQHAPVDNHRHTPSCIPVPDSSMNSVLKEDFDPLQSPPITPPHPLSAPPSLTRSPHEHTVLPPPSSSSIPSLFSSITPLLVDLAAPESEQILPESQLISRCYSQLSFINEGQPSL
ncbi:hypothetical protein KUCAC02_037436, partial [Chaenocephalus aceratus]